MVIRNRSNPLGGLVALRTLEALAGSAMLPFVVLWAHRDLGLGGIAAGALFVGQAAGEFGGGLACGGLADRYGRRRTLLISLTGMAVSYGLLAAIRMPAFAIAAFVAAGVFESAFHPTISALAGDVTPDERLPRAYSLLRIGANAGRIVGPMLGALLALATLPTVFAGSGVFLALAAVIAAWALPRDPAPDRDRPTAEEPDMAPGTLRALRTDGGLATLVLGCGLLSGCFTWWEADGLVLIGQQSPMTPAAWASLFTIAALTIVVAQLPITRLITRLRVPDGRNLLIGATGQTAGLALLTAAAAGGYPVLVGAVVLMALGEMVYAPTVSTVVHRRARPGQRASYQAALSVSEDIATAVGPISGLALARPLGVIGLWWSAAALSALAGLAGHRATRHRAPRRQATPSDGPASIA